MYDLTNQQEPQVIAVLNIVMTQAAQADNQAAARVAFADMVRKADKFGWNSPAMAMRYAEAAHIGNEGTARVKPQ